MMKRSLVGAAFVVASIGAVGVSAGTTVNLKGSDTLFDFTNAMIAGCPGTAAPYAGTGSGNGQSAMLAGTQQVAPMSRFLNNGACSGGAAAPTVSEGLVIGLDGLSIVGSRTTTASTTCNGNPNTACDSNFQPTTGAAFNTTITPTPAVACTTDANCPAGSGEVCACPGGAAQPCSPASSGTCRYTFNGWRDVLRILISGFNHDVIGTGAAQWAARDCSSSVRVSIANSYGNFFENNCASPGGDAAGPCVQIRHFFRRDDFSGTTDTVVSLLGLPAIVNPETTVNGVLEHTGATPFCNAVRPAFVYPTPLPTCLQGSDATWDPTQKNLGTGCTKENAVYRATMQDNDPVRRLCHANEDICSHSGDLGLVLTMNDATEPAPRTNADRFNTTACLRGRLASVTAPEVFDAITQIKQICTRGLLCPNGDVCNNLGGCVAPATGTGNVQCLSTRLTAPSLAISSQAVPVANPRIPAIAEGRAYNQHLFMQVGSAGAYQTNGFTTPLPMTGAFYRIHTSHSMNTATNRTCQFADATDQIGCLVEASPCSLGYAGLGSISASINPNSDAIKLNKQSPVTACIQSSFFIYPFARKLYLNTVPGFAAVTGQELQLAGCMTDLAQPTHNPPTPAGLVTTNIVAAGFLTLPQFLNNGLPYCEDFNEEALCGIAPNGNACDNLKPNFDDFPGFSTVCGDGLVDAFEDCDNGTLNGPPPATCSTICRSNN